MKTIVYIPLTKGYFAKIDIEDYARVAQYKWSLKTGQTGIKYGHRVDKQNKSIYLHRFVTGANKGQIVDHINRDGLDNRKSNLRFCTYSENAINSKNFSHNTSGYKGIYWDKARKKWASQIMINQKTIHLGRYEDLEEAIKQRKLAEKNYFPSL